MKHFHHSLTHKYDRGGSFLFLSQALGPNNIISYLGHILVNIIFNFFCVTLGVEFAIHGSQCPSARLGGWVIAIRTHLFIH